MLVAVTRSIPRRGFDSIYKEVALPLTKFIVKRTGGDSNAVDEVFSRTIEATWKSYKTFKHKSKFFTWVCRIALNKISDYYRSQVNSKSTLIVPLIENITETDNKPSLEEILSLDELRADVRDCINLLPFEARRLLYLKYWKDLSYEQIAKIIGTSERAVEGRLYRAKSALEQIISDKL